MNTQARPPAQRVTPEPIAGLALLGGMSAFLFAQRGFNVCLLEGGLWACGRGRKVT